MLNVHYKSTTTKQQLNLRCLMFNLGSKGRSGHYRRDLGISFHLICINIAPVFLEVWQIKALILVAGAALYFWEGYW